ncbi:MAG TPA: response regulator transcription factor [Opitutaceae bacterium]|nr:response regulator transcription factor [Opitutaceae bacterium]
MRASRLRVLICDDHELIREGLKRILLEAGIASHIGEAKDATETMAAVRRERWSIVILDINLGGRNGLEVLKAMKTEFPLQRVLMLSAYPEEQYALRAIRAGAAGYLNKNLASRVLVEAVDRVMAGGHYISPRVAELLASAVQQPAEQPLHAALSDREDQVLRRIGMARTVGQIAAELHLSVKTVSTYRSIVLRKLGLENNAQLMQYAQKHGLAD